jgi:hypothetical protein
MPILAHERRAARFWAGRDGHDTRRVVRLVAGTAIWLAAVLSLLT